MGAVSTIADKVSLFMAVALCSLLFLVGIYDAVAAYSGGQIPTISSNIQHYSKMYPVLPFILGLIIGHLLWPQG